MSSFRFRLPGIERAVSAWLAELLPGLDRATRRGLVAEGCVRVDGVRIDRIGFECPAGARVEIDDVPSDAFPEWADAIDRADADASADAWFAWVDAPPWFGGTLAMRSESACESDLQFEVVKRDHGLARLAMTGRGVSGKAICRVLAEAQMPVVGDLLRGGLGVAGGPLLRKSSDGLDEALAAGLVGSAAWPESSFDAEPLTLCVSDEAARAVTKGHLWILPDDASDAVDRFRPGTEVRVETRKGEVVGHALTDPNPRIAARMIAAGSKAPRSIDARIAAALARRYEILAHADADRPTDCYRLVHGEGDGIPGLFIDRVGALLRVLVSSRACDGIREQATRALLRQMPTTPEGAPWSLLELIHVQSPGASFDRVRWLVGGPESLEAAGYPVVDDRYWVSEHGLRFSVDPGWDSPRRTRPGFGLFTDQRENRERLRPHAARGGDWLNLFAHTGAFSVALLAAGASQVESVDLSGPYLDRLGDNLKANRERGVNPERHRRVRGEGRRYLETLPAARRFDGIVLDPPTAAASGRRFWSVRQDLEPLIRLCIDRLNPGGVLLVTQNRQGPSLGINDSIEHIAHRAHRRVRDLRPAPAGPDFPSDPAFPEGEAFEGWILELDE